MPEVSPSPFFWASYSLNNRRKSVLFPLPLAPTKAREPPAGTVTESPSMIFLPLSYPKLTFLNSTESPSSGTTSAGAFSSSRTALFSSNK